MFWFSKEEEFANYFHYGYHECMKNMVHYLTTEDRAETKDIKYAWILAFLQSKSCVVTEPVFGSVGSMPEASDYLAPKPQPVRPVYQQSPPGHFSWHSSARSPAITDPKVPLSAHTQQHVQAPVPEHDTKRQKTELRYVSSYLHVWTDIGWMQESFPDGRVDNGRMDEPTLIAWMVG
ncbi:unnamed protein product [Pleuronectes platessa]|uniref:Orange domain-containing protein n=1 Tax=Pleuronectes platessa TaxID=8262 RepID=A0A9N7VIC8_PLEPL|nr:unnamed protein product [Pleuronectes platessa]